MNHRRWHGTGSAGRLEDVRHRGRSRRRYILPFLSCFLLAASVLTIPSSAWAFGQDGASPGVINGIPDVTGFGNSHGSISLTKLQAAAPGTLVRASSVQIDGLARGYLLITPAHDAGLTAPMAASTPVPLIVMLGGVNASPTQEAGRDEFLPLVEQGLVSLVYPAGYSESWNVGTDGCCGSAAAKDVDDVAFTRAVTLAVGAQLHPSATYLVGFSNGGKLAYQVMCADPQLFQALVAVAASPLAGCPHQVPRSVMITVGTKDTELPMQGHIEAAPALLDATLATWRDYDGCGAGPALDSVGTALESTWTSCAGGSRVEGVLYSGLDHEWPTSALVGAPVAGAKLIWAFLSDVGSA
jgi:polyhydroxybutyrate depolymerase